MSSWSTYWSCFLSVRLLEEAAGAIINQTKGIVIRWLSDWSDEYMPIPKCEDDDIFLSFSFSKNMVVSVLCAWLLKRSLPFCVRRPNASLLMNHCCTSYIYFRWAISALNFSKTIIIKSLAVRLLILKSVATSLCSLRLDTQTTCVFALDVEKLK